ncbi:MULTISPECIES: AAA family ATPase [Dietzia]|uniref:AAA family ATPase n=1 Tax=Dietzia cinnamea TaxID=321318 RepID=A0AAW5QDC7_9ACTN|nr:MULTISPECIES: AAA family ATPase [Dietzia]MCT1641530.1 ATP-binding protein [Dietzia cinnamea]MCT1713433.1 ATP-binding protein [Dietzia cinnamea]MCT1865651.1 ATP-binding protein [Dietzia cinnamea]MCT2028673.1 ATP-binding protein [Dietzia cinnamea]MCT2034824.1 ATP-binding protein [Dietzia cinnamea]
MTDRAKGTLIWINGPHGSGKTHTAANLTRRLPAAQLADPEHVGFGLRRMYPRTARPDYRSLDAWITATSSTMIDILDRTGGTVIAPQTVTDTATLTRLLDPVRQAEHRVLHVTLMTGLGELQRRLRTRGDVIASYAQRQSETAIRVLSAPAFASHLDTTNRTVQQVADDIATLAGLELTPDRTNILSRSIRSTCLRISAIRAPWA